MDREIQKSKDYIFTWKKYQNGLQIIPTSAVITIFDNGGTSKQTGAGSIDSEGTITYTFLAANNSTQNKNFKINLVYIYNAKSYEENQLFDVVLTPLVNTVSDNDLFVFLPDLRKNIFEITGETDTNGTLSTLQDNMLKSDNRDFTGGKVEIFVLDTKVHEANITTYSKTTGIITFSPSYSSTITNGIKYMVRESYSNLIQTSFDSFVIKDVRNRIGLGSKWIDSNIIKNLIIFKTLNLFCFHAIESEADKWFLRARQYESMYNDELQKIKEPTDENEDGNISDSENNENMGWMSRNIIR